MKMKVTRRGVFEPNSSSTHTITIAGGMPYRDYKTDRLSADKGICRIHPGEYGWEERTYTDAATKASYCLTWAKQYGRPEHLEALRRVIRLAHGVVVEFVESIDEHYKWGYIDHQSDDVGGQAFENYETLRDFIFNPASVLETDNDNH